MIDNYWESENHSSLKIWPPVSLHSKECPTAIHKCNDLSTLSKEERKKKTQRWDRYVLGRTWEELKVENGGCIYSYFVVCMYELLEEKG